MVDAAGHANLEVAVVFFASQIELLAKNNAGTPIQEVGIALINRQTSRSGVVLALSVE